jgi:amidase
LESNEAIVDSNGNLINNYIYAGGSAPFMMLNIQSEVLEINGIKLRNIIDYLTITYDISLTGLPALSIPCSWTVNGLPIGIQLVGNPHGEVALLQFAFFLQEALNFRHRWPE